MKFWDDGQTNSTRIRNVNYTWQELKNLTAHLQNNGIDCKEFLYDFSPEKLIQDAKHVPYPLGVYKKAEKTNVILEDNSNYDFFMMFDCDAFIDPNDYPKILNILKTLQEGDVYLFDLAKLHDNVNTYIVDKKFVKENADWSYAYSGNKEFGPLRSCIGGLGGVYLCDTKLLISLGGFDISYEGWGGEDGDMLGRIMYSKLPHKINSVRDFSPYHLPHFSDWGNSNYYKRK